MLRPESPCRAGLCAGLLLVSAAALAPARVWAEEPDDDEDFEPLRPFRTLAAGPNPRGDAVVSLDVGWLRSGARMDLGFGAGIDLVLEADAWLFHGLFDAQNSVNLGLRWSPFSAGALRASIEGTAGQTFLEGGRGVQNVTTFRGELVVGGAFEPVLVYGRAAVRGLHDEAVFRDDWALDQEFGGGLEYAWRAVRIGAEAFAWTRSSRDGLGQWRIRVGWVH